MDSRAPGTRETTGHARDKSTTGSSQQRAAPAPASRRDATSRRRRTAPAARYLPRTFRHPARVSFDRHARGAPERAPDNETRARQINHRQQPATSRAGVPRRCNVAQATHRASSPLPPAHLSSPRARVIRQTRARRARTSARQRDMCETTQTPRQPASAAPRPAPRAPRPALRGTTARGDGVRVTHRESSSLCPAHALSRRARVCRMTRARDGRTCAGGCGQRRGNALRRELRSWRSRTKIRGNWWRRILEQCRPQFPLIL